MAGMQVTAYFASGASSTHTWRDLGLDADADAWFGVRASLLALTFAVDANTGAPWDLGWALRR